jgi:hypothetical protein
MGFKPGNDPNRNLAGRPKGSHNETTTMVKETFAALLAGEQDNLAAALEAVREKDPTKFLAFWIEISTRFVPQVSRQEITGLDGADFKPINIILPSNNLTQS